MGQCPQAAVKPPPALQVQRCGEPQEQSDAARAVRHPRCTRCFLHQEQGQHRQRSPPTSSHVLTVGFPHQRALLLSNSLTSVRSERNKTLF